MKLPMYTDPDGIDLEAEKVDQKTWLTCFMFIQHYDLTKPDFQVKRRISKIPCGDKRCQYNHHYVLWDLYAHGDRVTTVLGLVVNSLKDSALKKAYKQKVEAIEAARKEKNPGLAMLIEMSEIPRGDFDYILFKIEYDKWINAPDELAMKP